VRAPGGLPFLPVIASGQTRPSPILIAKVLEDRDNLKESSCRHNPGRCRIPGRTWISPGRKRLLIHPETPSRGIQNFIFVRAVGPAADSRT